MLFEKDVESLKIGLAISTYSERNTEKKRYEIIERSLNSLRDILKNKEIYVVIVVDGEIPEVHNELLKKYNFEIYRREKNGGVAKTKNTCIRLLMEKKIDIGFLADDDVLFKNNCFEIYKKFIYNTNCHHLISCYPHPEVHPVETWDKLNYKLEKYKGELIRKHNGGVGYFLSFTRELINKIGYFTVLPQKFGSEHVNFSKRVISMNMAKFHFDIDKSVNYVEHIGFWPLAENLYGKCHSISKTNQKKCSEENRKYVNIDLHKKIECVE